MPKESAVYCNVCGHGPESIFCALAGAHLDKLGREKTVHKYEKGQVVFFEATPSLAVYCVYSGAVKLFKTGPRGDTQVIRLIGPGETFGYPELLANSLCTATAEAVEASVICIVPRSTLLDLLRQSPAFAMRLLARLAVDLKTSEEQIFSMARETVRQRTARLLLFLAEEMRHKTKADPALRIPLFRSEMAQMVGTTPETLSRTLHYLAGKGILQVTRAEISINNYQVLQKLATLG